jgi:hypothetical protein
MIWPLVYLFLGFGLQLVSTCLLCHWLRLDRHGMALWLLSMWVCVSTSMVVSVTFLGYIGGLSETNLLLWQVVQVALVVTLVRPDPDALRSRFAGFKQQLSKVRVQSSPLMKCLAGFLFAVVMVVFVAAVFGRPGDFDSHGYRLSRIGLWLQEGSLFQTATTDARMNYSAIVGDLQMLWLTAPFEQNYPLVTAVQGVAGLFTLLSVWVLARLIGFTRGAALVAICLMLSMAAFVAQMTTEQVDLLVGAYAVAAVALFYAGLRLGMHPLAGALALALAFGTKGSMFYFLPGLVLVGAVALFAERTKFRDASRFVGFSLFTMMLLAAPRYVENYRAYGNPFAPSEDIERLHDGSGVGGFSMEKLRLNSLCYAIQVFGPVSNPFGTFQLTRPVGDRLGEYLPAEKDVHSVSRSRAKWFELFQNKKMQHEYSLIGSTGALSFLLAIMGVFLAAVRFLKTRDRTSGWVLLIFLCALSYHVFMAGFFKWSPFKFRYYLMIAPFVAVLGAYCFQHTRWLWFRNYAIGAIGVLCVLSGFRFFTTGITSGMGMFQSQPNSLTEQIVEAQRGALGEILIEGSRLAVSLPYYARLSGFFRNGTDVEVILVEEDELGDYVSAEEFLDGEDYDAVATRSMHWPEVGSGVTGIAWHPLGDPRSRDGFEVIRRRLPGDDSIAFVRSVEVDQAQSAGKRCQTYTLSDGPGRAELLFIGQGEGAVDVSFPSETTGFTLGASETRALWIEVNASEEIGYCFQSAAGSEEVELQRRYPLVLARNFRALYSDVTGMLNLKEENRPK